MGLIKRLISYMKDLLHRMKAMELPPIGMRIIKTILAVFTCFVIEYFIGVRSPFNAPMTALLCMQRDMRNSIQIGVTRVVGTIVGGFLGLAILLVFQKLPFGPHSLPYYFVVSICMIPVIYTTLLLKKPEAAAITCILYMTIVLGDFEDTTPLLFTIKRTADTLIGIGVAFFINWLPILDRPEPFHLHKHHDEENE